MEALLISTVVVAIGEIGDKTQLLSLLLAARFKRPIPIVLGIFIATLANHSLAGLMGEWIRITIPTEYLRLGLGISFLIVALWTLKPDEIEEDPKITNNYGVFFVTLTMFFVAEIGDKTQLATVMLATKFESLVSVVAGTTLGMLIADVPAVFLGDKISKKIPMKLVRSIAAIIFMLLGFVTLFNLGTPLLSFPR